MKNKIILSALLMFVIASVGFAQTQQKRLLKPSYVSEKSISNENIVGTKESRIVTSVTPSSISANASSILSRHW